MKTRYIETWDERAKKHPDHDGVVTNAMIQERMQEEIDDLRRVYDCARTLVSVRGRYNTEQAFKRLEECLSIVPSNDQLEGTPKAFPLDAPVGRGKD